jgi:glycosyltransferase involved in cell wall biosynthesis
MISILIPIYNGVEFIEESVSSVLNQTYEQWELLIGINGHPQNSNVYKIAKEYEKKSENAGEPSGKIRVFDFYKIKGKSNTLNEMIKYCTFNYIAILDVDDIWHPQKLEIQSQALNNFDVIGSQCVYFGERLNGIKPNIPFKNISNIDFSIVNPIINSSTLIRKELCYWNKEWDGVEDYDLWLQLRKQNKKFYNFKEILVKHRIHSSSAFNAKGNDNKVDNLLISHGFKSRAERQNDPTRIQVPQINKIKMNLF